MGGFKDEYLKPCPFCGETHLGLYFRLIPWNEHYPPTYWRKGLRLYAVRCINPKCRAMVEGFITKEEARNAWNRRNK